MTEKVFKIGLRNCDAHAFYTIGDVYEQKVFGTRMFFVRDKKDVTDILEVVCFEVFNSMNGFKGRAE